MIDGAHNEMTQGALLAHENYLGLPQNKQRYIKKTVSIGPSYLDYYVPKDELKMDTPNGSNMSYYENTVIDPAKKIVPLFGLPQRTRVLFIETTDDWNALNYFDKRMGFKKTGDRYKGVAIANDTIVVFTPPGLRNETNFVETNSEIQPSQVIPAIVGHELTHASIESQLGELAHSQRQFPMFVSEAIPLLMFPFQNWRKSPEKAARLYKLLESFKNPPDHRFFSSTYFPGFENDSPVGYAYGRLFFNWLIEQDLQGQNRGIEVDSGTYQMSDEHLSYLVKLVDNIKRGDGFENAFERTFSTPERHTTYSDAFSRFQTYLDYQSKGNK